MRRFCILVMGVLSFTLQAPLRAQLPEDYQSLSAQQKQELLWSEITKSHEEVPLPEFSGTGFKDVLLKLKGLFNLGPTFDHASDEVPAGRVKIIHANGSVAKIAFVPTTNHPFTGIYKEGGIGLARLSLATPPKDGSYIPGMAIKILVSQHPSLNLHVMNLLEGQNENWNYFAKDFSNSLPHPTSWTLSAIEKIFEWTRDPANNLPLWHWAAWSTNGSYNGIPVFPERLYFRPASEVSTLIAEQSREDFRLSLEKIPMGPLYEVYGLYQGVEYHVGTLILESSLLASNYGDKELFFQHQR